MRTALPPFPPRRLAAPLSMTVGSLGWEEATRATPKLIFRRGQPARCRKDEPRFVLQPCRLPHVM